jgi:hypothetical protein
MYNGVYLGKNYHKPHKRADYGNPDVDLSRLPTTYYHDKSPIGVVLQKYNWFPGKENTYAADARLPASLIGMGGHPLGQLADLWSEPPIAVLCLSVGTLASYGRPAQTMHFTERIPTFVKLSESENKAPPYFHYVQDALQRGVNLKIFEGEPRPTFEKHGGERFYQLIVIESWKLAVSTVHKDLMTREGMEMLMGKLREDGIICYHSSNRYYNLAPIIASVAKDLKYACVIGTDLGDWGKQDRAYDRFSSNWVMVARDEKHLAHLKTPADYKLRNNVVGDSYWSAPKRTEQKFIWTDKGENSFRGVYYGDPDIAKLSEMLYKVERCIEGQVGWSSYQYTRRVHDMIRAWSQASGEAMNRDLPDLPKKKNKKAPKE